MDPARVPIPTKGVPFDGGGRGRMYYDCDDVSEGHTNIAETKATTAEKGPGHTTAFSQLSESTPLISESIPDQSPAIPILSTYARAHSSLRAKTVFDAGDPSSIHMIATTEVEAVNTGPAVPTTAQNERVLQQDCSRIALKCATSPDFTAPALKPTRLSPDNPKKHTASPTRDQVASTPKARSLTSSSAYSAWISSPPAVSKDTAATDVVDPTSIIVTAPLDTAKPRLAQNSLHPHPAIRRPCYHASVNFSTEFLTHVCRKVLARMVKQELVPQQLHPELNKPSDQSQQLSKKVFFNPTLTCIGVEGLATAKVAHRTWTPLVGVNAMSAMAALTPHLIGTAPNPVIMMSTPKCVNERFRHLCLQSG
jgi:hypothetical protein